MKSAKTWGVLLPVAFAALGAQARTVNVPGDYADIASALAAVDPAADDPIDTIRVAAGDYASRPSLSLTRR